MATKTNYNMDRMDIDILSAFVMTDEEGKRIVFNKAISGLTIVEVIQYLSENEINRSHTTVRRHMMKLLENDYISKGLASWKADTFFITSKGEDALAGNI
jgi:hypothetical protein